MFVFLYSMVAGLMFISLLGSTNICFYIEHFKYFGMLGLQCSFLLPLWGHANICVRIEYLVYFGVLGLQRSFSLPFWDLRIYVFTMNNLNIGVYYGYRVYFYEPCGTREHMFLDWIVLIFWYIRVTSVYMFSYWIFVVFWYIRAVGLISITLFVNYDYMVL